ncbi:hypothetical protein, partial [Halobellus sp. Atlit-38R]|uniref:hypothetical protein n=1 Tax=Halobellus sp. Atlit-38R TaxID=2282131 RepID=UPI001F30ADC2
YFDKPYISHRYFSMRLHSVPDGNPTTSFGYNVWTVNASSSSVTVTHPVATLLGVFVLPTFSSRRNSFQ